MLGPLVVLAVLSIVGGWVGVPKSLGGNDGFDRYLRPVVHTLSEPQQSAERGAEPTKAEEPAHEEGNTELALTGASVGVALFGLLVAWFLYIRRPELPGRISAASGGLYRAIWNKYWVDEAYYATLVDPIVNGSREILWRGIDQEVIDGAVNFAGTGSKRGSRWLRRMQSGNIRSYATWVALGAAAVVIFMIWIGAH